MPGIVDTPKTRSSPLHQVLMSGKQVFFLRDSNGTDRKETWLRLDRFRLSGELEMPRAFASRMVFLFELVDKMSKFGYHSTPSESPDSGIAEGFMPARKSYGQNLFFFRSVLPDESKSLCAGPEKLRAWIWLLIGFIPKVSYKSG